MYRSDEDGEPFHGLSQKLPLGAPPGPVGVGSKRPLECRMTARAFVRRCTSKTLVGMRAFPRAHTF